jgi:hypothetical protein
MPESYVSGEARQTRLERRKQDRLMSGPAAEYMPKIRSGKEKNEDGRCAGKRLFPETGYEL